MNTTNDNIPAFQRANASPCDQIIIAGGGLAGIFTAYEILRQAHLAKREIDVVVLADTISAPCPAGSHIVREHEGLFLNRLKNRDDINRLFLRAEDSLLRTIAREKIDCALSLNYEFKAESEVELKETVDDLVKRGIYNRSEFNFDPQAQKFNLPGYDHSVRMQTIGQVSTPKLLTGLADCIRDMGGRFLEGAVYERQEKTAAGQYLVHSNVGTFISKNKPLLATGAKHMRTLPGFDFKTTLIHTMCVVMGPLDEADRRRISSEPVAISDTVLDGDVLWGGLDPDGHLTLGRGDGPEETDARRQFLIKDLSAQIERLYPGLVEKYPVRETLGTMMIADNHLPIVGRMADYNVMTAWAGEGIVPGYAAAKAYATWILHQDDTDLKVFESMQPGHQFESQIPRGGKNMIDRPIYNYVR